MAAPSEKHATTEMAKEAERIIHRTPPEVVRAMELRLKELRRTPQQPLGIDLLNKPAG